MEWLAKEFKNTEYYNLLNGSIKFPTSLPFDPKIGFEQNKGAYLNPEHYIANDFSYQQFYAGVSLPLGQGLITDDRRIALRQAQLLVDRVYQSILGRQIFGIKSDGNMHQILDPLNYMQMLRVVDSSTFVVTDSGGLQEETTVLGIPCITIRENTERPVTVTVGTNEVVGTSPAGLLSAVDRILSGQWKKGGIPEGWDGRAGERIVAIMERFMKVAD